MTADVSTDTDWDTTNWYRESYVWYLYKQSCLLFLSISEQAFNSVSLENLEIP